MDLLLPTDREFTLLGRHRLLALAATPAAFGAPA
jgi:hypothetical protein